MSDDVTPRRIAAARARVIYDRALARIAADRAAGRLTPEQVELHDRLYARQQSAAAPAVAA